MTNIPKTQPEFNARYETLPCKQKLMLRLFLLGLTDQENARLDLTFDDEEIALILVSFCKEEIIILFNEMSNEQSQQVNSKLNNTAIIKRLSVLREDANLESLKTAKATVRRNIYNSGKHFGFSDDKREKLVKLFWQYKSELVDSSRLTEYGLNFLPYVRNFINEEKYENYIKEPGSLVRIRSPRLMGKTFLINNLLKRLKGNNQYKIVYFTFNNCDNSVLFNYQTLTKYFCQSLIKKMGLNPSLIEEWEDIFTPNENINILLEKFLRLLPEDLILILDDLDKIFELSYCGDFCSLLRHFFNKSRFPGENQYKLWEKLHLIIAHSTDSYATLDINNSPLANVGETINLQHFTIDEVQKLSKQYSLRLNNSELHSLYHLISGHPYLVTLTFNHLKNNSEERLKNIIEFACQKESIYSGYLRGLLAILKQSEDLMNAYGNIVGSTTTINIDNDMTWKLDSLGLIKQDSTNKVTYFCDLYRRYFQKNL